MKKKSPITPIARIWSSLNEKEATDSADRTDWVVLGEKEVTDYTDRTDLVVLNEKEVTDYADRTDLVVLVVLNSVLSSWFLVPF